MSVEEQHFCGRCSALPLCCSLRPVTRHVDKQRRIIDDYSLRKVPCVCICSRNVLIDWLVARKTAFQSDSPCSNVTTALSVCIPG